MIGSCTQKRHFVGLVFVLSVRAGPVPLLLRGQAKPGGGDPSLPVPHREVGGTRVNPNLRTKRPWPRIPLAFLTMIVYAFLSRIAIGEGRIGWSGDSAERDSMMDLGIARKVVGWSTLRRRGKPIEDSRVQDPEQNAQMESLDHREYVGGLWEEIGRLQFKFLLRQGLAPSDCFLDIACGSLRGGVHFIDYLNPGNYLGIEKQRRLVELGIEKGVNSQWS